MRYNTDADLSAPFSEQSDLGLTCLLMQFCEYFAPIFSVIIVHTGLLTEQYKILEKFQKEVFITDITRAFFINRKC